MLTIAGATVNQTPFHWSHNTSNIIQAIKDARKRGAQLVCFPELCITGYGCEDMFLSNWLSAKAWEELEKIIPFSDGITVCVGLPIRIEDVTYNAVAVIHNQKILGLTLKQNLAIDGVHYETRWFRAWQPEKIIELTINGTKVLAGDIIYNIEGTTIGFEICEDAWRKDRPGNALFKRGVQLILNPSASHFALGKSITREELVANSSGKFNCAYLYVNLLGNEAGRMIYDGDILVAQQGKLLIHNTRLSFKPYNIVTCAIDVETPEKSEAHPLIDNKEKNEEFTRAVTLALYDYLRKSKAKGFALSLSGGADSSTCATLIAEMIKRATNELGWPTFLKAVRLPETSSQNFIAATNQLLTCAYQASGNSSLATLEAAKILAESIGAEFHSWSIEQEVNSYVKKIEQAFKRKTTWAEDDISLQNIQARARSPLIWMLANMKQSILLTTSNRSEGDVGYATMDGDTSGSLAPLAGISKFFVLQWLKWAEAELKYTGLHAVNQLQPTAELRPQERHQTDEDDLMPYAILVEIERHAILERKSPIEVFHQMIENHPNREEVKKYITKFYKLWAANQWKRERLAPSFHLDELNVDPRSWCRFPILSSGFQEELELLKTL
jgi:NAD+ synthase (glutamine-hydrolysing)